MNYLVIGASGYLGNTIYQKLLANGETVFGTFNRHRLSGLVPLNLFDESSIKKAARLNPGVVIFAACDRNNEFSLSQKALPLLLENLPQSVRFIYISTMVGTGRNQTEGTLPVLRSENDYLSNYFNGKIEGERITRLHENHVIIRPGSIYGYDFCGNMDFRMRTLKQIFKSGQNYKRTANLYTSFVDVKDLADAVIELCVGEFKGTVNISGEKAVSYFLFNRYLASLLHIRDDFIIPEHEKSAVYRTFDNTLRKNIIKTKIHEI